MNITKLQKLHDLPLPLNPLRLNNGSGIEQTLVENGAKYHPSCYLLFSNTQVQRAKKRKETGTGDTDLSHSRAKRSHIDTKQNVCFICKEFDERKNLHQVEFVKTCVKLKEMANSVNDIRLMATLSGPDAIALELKYHTQCYIDLSNRLRSAISNVQNQTERIFCGIAIDQAHEQNNALIKADGGAIGLTERESALRRWMVAGPEVCRLAEQYEKFSRKRKKIHTKHHEDAPFAHKAFLKDVRNLILVLEEMGNPFMEESTTDLLTIDSKDVMNKSVLDMLYAFVPKGKEQLNNLLKNLSGNFYAPLTRNKFSLFETSKTKQTKEHDKLKDDYNLFSNLFVSCQTRQVDLDEFFKYENQIVPAALSSHDELYKTNKADLLTCLETFTPAESVWSIP